MVSDRAFTTNSKMLNMANLLDRPVILLNLPVLVMDFGKVVTLKRNFLWHLNHVVATLVF